MIYIFDTCSFRVINHYFPECFPGIWEKIGALVKQGNFISVQEVYHELDAEGGLDTEREGVNKPFLKTWIKKNKKIFLIPTSNETTFVADIFKIPHFKNLISLKQQLKNAPVADPFLIASAKIRNACVVTEEKFKPNAAKIPNICKHFNVDFTDVEGFMEKENWKF